jgi:hypothetical protein
MVVAYWRDTRRRSAVTETEDDLYHISHVTTLPVPGLANSDQAGLGLPYATIQCKNVEDRNQTVLRSYFYNALKSPWPRICGCMRLLYALLMR